MLRTTKKNLNCERALSNEYQNKICFLLFCYFFRFCGILIKKLRVSFLFYFRPPKDKILNDNKNALFYVKQSKYFIYTSYSYLCGGLIIYKQQTLSKYLHPNIIGRRNELISSVKSDPRSKK